MTSLDKKTNTKSESLEQTKLPSLKWFNLLVVIPCILLFIATAVTDDVIFAIIGLFLAPVALVTLFLDVYYFVTGRKDKIVD